MTVSLRRSGLAAAASLALIAGVVVASPSTAAGAGSISGTIEAPASFPNAVMFLYDENGVFTGVTVPTTYNVVDSNWNYTLTGLDAGDYYLAMAPNLNPVGNYSAVYWHSTLDDVNLFEDAQAITVDLDEEVVGIDFTAVSAGFIAGSVSVPDGLGPDGNHFVLLHRLSVVTGQWEEVSFHSMTVSTGSDFFALRVAPGNYRFEYRSTLPAYRAIFADGKLSLDTATIYAVPAGNSTQSLNLPEQTLTWAGPVSNSRYSDSDRYGTAIKVSQLTAPFGQVPGSTVYLAAGANFPDALSAAPAAAAAGGPLLLTPSAMLPTNVRTELIRLDPARVVIAGGTGVISNAVKAAVESALPGAQVDRISGADRYATSRALTEDAFPSYDGGPLFVATGANFPDALSAAAAAGYLGAPVLLVPGTATSLSTSTLNFIESMTPDTVYIAGGTGVVSLGIEGQLDASGSIDAVVRLAGADRYSTSVAINEQIFDQFVDSEFVYLANGTGFADALAGAARAGADGAPLYVTPRTCVALGIEQGIGRVDALELRLLGGTGVLAASVASLTRCA